MSSLADDIGLQRFRELIHFRMGLAFPEDHAHRLHDVLVRRLGQLDVSCGTYLERLDHGESEGEWERLADELTIGETFFFRNTHHFQALCEGVVPELLHAPGRPRRSLHILSAGCSSGEEPYSLVMALQDGAESLAGIPHSVTAIDINPQAIARAQRGTYTSWSLRETTPAQRDHHFQTQGQLYHLSESIRHQVNFEVRNLLRADAVFWCPQRFDVIFCRNVLMYLKPEIAQHVVERFARSLIPGGFLFLGHAETLRTWSNAFEICSTHGTFYYRFLDAAGIGGEPPRSDSLAWQSALAIAPSSHSGVSPHSNAWVGAIGRSAERVATLADAALRAVENDLALARIHCDPAASYPRVLGFLQQERYAEAVVDLLTLPMPQRQAWHAVLMAVAKFQLGEAAQAEIWCKLRLAEDPLDVRCLYVLGLCREQSQDPDQAMVHYRAAATSAQEFAVPHLRLGLLLRRAAHHLEARAEFAQALALIAKENELDLILFGGGFTRQAIADLCRSQVTGASQ